MSGRWNRPWTGGLFGWRDAAKMRDIGCVAGIRVEDPGTAGWQALLYQTERPLVETGEPQKEAYDYEFLVRVSGPHAIFVGTDGELVEAFVQRAGLRTGIYVPRVHVDRLVENLASATDDRFSMGAIFARVEGYGNSLRSIALWGADIADAELFHKIRENLAPYRVELRDVTHGTLLLSIGSRGELNFNYDGAEALTKVTSTVHVLTREKYVEWPA